MKPLAFTLLRILADGNYHSGTALGRMLNISRSSVFNMLSKLECYGVTIHRVRGRGYRWLNPVRWLDSEQIRHYLAEYGYSIAIEIADVVESTNSLLLQRAMQQEVVADQGIQVLAAELQTQGRGRRGRTWSSGLGDSLTFSVLWPSKCTVNALSGLSLAVGIAIVRVLATFEICNIALKWPNDVIADHNKLAGVLIELHGDMLSPSKVIIGIGLNTKLSAIVKNQIERKVTDIATIAAQVPDRNQLLAALLRELIQVLESFEQNGFAPFVEEWQRYHAYQHKAVRISFPDGNSKDGVAIGVASDGALLVEMGNETVQLRSGEVSLRGLAK